MIARVIEWSATNRGAVIAIALLAAAAVWWSLRHVLLDAVPDLSARRSAPVLAVPRHDERVLLNDGRQARRRLALEQVAVQ